MSESTVHTVDRTGWPEGPWSSEPDKIQFTTEAGLPALIVRNPVGALCGYVAVSRGHPAFESHYDEVDVSVHGGLTYSDHCQTDGPICHIPEPGQPDDVWWLGFDCAHTWDVMPRTLALELAYGGGRSVFRELSDLFAGKGLPQREDVYRDVAYVRAECESLAAQLVALAEEGGSDAPHP